MHSHDDKTAPEHQGQALVLYAGGGAAAEVAGRAAGLGRGQRQAAHGGDAGVQAGAVLLPGDSVDIIIDLDMSAHKAGVADVARAGVHGPGLGDGDDQAGGERH